MSQDIRWKQRFENYKKAFLHLHEAVTKKELSNLEKAGLVQIYEFTFELAWKTLKDYMQEKQVEVNFPKDTIKEAFKYELIEDGDTWMDMLEKRNLMAHTYNETNAELACGLIVNHYFKVLEKLLGRLQNEQ